MGRILIWEDVLNEVFGGSGRQVMFGIDGCVRNSRTSDVYDFLFHLQDVDYRDVRDDDFWAVPVLDYEEDRIKRYKLMGEVPRENAGIDTVAVKTFSPISCERAGRESTSLIHHLEFYKVGPRRASRLIKKYDVTNDDEMRRIVGNWEEVEKQLDELREEIKLRYS